ncbi:hypothetical protein SynA1560_00851 [Synechococcus sp. A15-60]|nr:hypothetical protein SynA1560_00851 [Synechococcus sp. A15-60]
MFQSVQGFDKYCLSLCGWSVVRTDLLDQCPPFCISRPVSLRVGPDWS